MTAYTVDSDWRKRSEFLKGREAIVQFLTCKWARELDYRLIKEIWSFQDDMTIEIGLANEPSNA
jgi:nuclear transport factor 2 (NTF2) superfamily protein